jgi:hypothetical protein
MGNHCAAAFNNQQINPRLQAADVNGGFFAGEVKGFHRAAVGGEEGTFRGCLIKRIRFGFFFCEALMAIKSFYSN